MIFACGVLRKEIGEERGAQSESLYIKRFMKPISATAAIKNMLQMTAKLFKEFVLPNVLLIVR